MNRLVVMLALVVVLASAYVVVGADEGKDAPIPDGDFSLYPGSVFDVPTPPAFAENDALPGSNTRITPMFAGAPPQVPHGVNDFLPITREDNGCLGCHLVEPDPDEEAPLLPESHRRDLRTDPSTVGDAAAGARWVCTACHVAVTDAKPLVQGVAER